MDKSLSHRHPNRPSYRVFFWLVTGVAAILVFLPRALSWIGNGSGQEKDVSNEIACSNVGAHLQSNASLVTPDLADSRQMQKSSTSQDLLPIVVSRVRNADVADADNRGATVAYLSEPRMPLSRIRMRHFHLTEETPWFCATLDGPKCGSIRRNYFCTNFTAIVRESANAYRPNYTRAA